MNGVEIRKIRNKIGVSQKKLAEMLGVHWRTVQNWEKTGDISHSDYTNLCAIIGQPATLLPQTYAGGEQQNVNGDNVIGNNVTVHEHDRTNELMELLANRDKALEKAQEQIDRLLSIMEKMTNK